MSQITTIGETNKMEELMKAHNELLQNLCDILDKVVDGQQSIASSLEETVSVLKGGE